MGANGDGIHLAFPRPQAGVSDVGNIEALIRGLASDVKDQAVLIREMASAMKTHAAVAKTLAEQNLALAERVAALERERRTAP